MVILVRLILSLFVKLNIFDKHLGLFIGVNKNKIVEQEDIIVPFKKVEFVENRKFFLSFTVIVIVVGSIMAITNGVNLGVDFTGGTTITVAKNEEFKLDDVQSYLEDEGYTIRKEEESSKDIVVTISEVLDKNDIKELSNSLESEYGITTDIYTVSKVVKQELTKNAIYSLVLASIGILIYIGVRFKFNYGIAAVVSLIHDSLLIFLFFCIFDLEITAIFIAAVLTIIGYSINDTIVTFDMIRDVYKKKLLSKIGNKKKNIEEVKVNDEELVAVVNDSVRITLFRSLLTALTTLVPVICLMIWGAREIVNFNIALLVGFIAGVYSSIYIANQIWLILEMRRLKKPKKEKKNNDNDELEELEIKGVNC